MRIKRKERKKERECVYYEIETRFLPVYHGRDADVRAVPSAQDPEGQDAPVDHRRDEVPRLPQDPLVVVPRVRALPSLFFNIVCY